MNRHRLLIVLTLLLATGFIVTSLVSYYVSRLTIHDTIVRSELPLTADNIYSEIQKDLVRPVFISSMMASDTFLRDWVIEGEKDPARVSKYLQEVQERYKAFVSFFVAEDTRNYYYGQGLLKQVKEGEPRDAWYFRVRQMQQPYEINVDRDMAHADALTIFVNYRVLDYDNRYIGAVGVGLTVNSVQSLLASYQRRYQRNVFFVGRDGTIMLSGSTAHPQGGNIGRMNGLSRLLPGVLQHDSGSYEYSDHANHLINVRYIPELKWYLFVEKSEDEAINGITNTLYLNLLLCLLITGIVIFLTHLALRRYQLQLEKMATTDILTGLPNRRAFGIVIDVISNESQRNGNPVAVILLDIDHFKQVNDRYGHATGDDALSSVGRTVKSCLRASDFICRWGGEEFLIVLKDCDADSLGVLTEKIRAAVAAKPAYHKGEEVWLTVSLGAALAQQQETIAQLIERADNAMYRAKQEGRNRVVISAAVEAPLHD